MKLVASFAVIAGAVAQVASGASVPAICSCLAVPADGTNACYPTFNADCMLQNYGDCVSGAQDYCSQNPIPAEGEKMCSVCVPAIKDGGSLMSCAMEIAPLLQGTMCKPVDPTPQPVNPTPQPTPRPADPTPQPVNPTPQPTPRPAAPTPQPVEPTPQPTKPSDPLEQLLCHDCTSVLTSGCKDLSCVPQECQQSVVSVCTSANAPKVCTKCTEAFLNKDAAALGQCVDTLHDMYNTQCIMPDLCPACESAIDDPTCNDLQCIPSDCIENVIGLCTAPSAPAACQPCEAAVSSGAEDMARQCAQDVRAYVQDKCEGNQTKPPTPSPTPSPTPVPTPPPTPAPTPQFDKTRDYLRLKFTIKAFDKVVTLANIMDLEGKVCDLVGLSRDECDLLFVIDQLSNNIKGFDVNTDAELVGKDAHVYLDFWASPRLRDSIDVLAIVQKVTQILENHEITDVLAEHICCVSYEVVSLTKCEDGEYRLDCSSSDLSGAMVPVASPLAAVAVSALALSTLC